MKLHQHNLTKKITILATTLGFTPLVAFLLLAAAPTITPKASATTEDSEMDISVEEVLSLRIVEQNPTTGEWDVDTNTISATTRYNNFGHATVKVIASTNAPGGYTLSLNDVDNNTSLASTTVLNTIPTLPGNKTLVDLDDSTDQFPENSWGYSWNKNSDDISLVFNPIPASNASSSAKQKDVTDGVGLNTYNFTVGVKVAETTPASTYRDHVLFTLVGNPAPSASAFFTTTYMDQFTANICNTVDTPSANVTNVTNVNGYDYVSGGTIVPSTLVKDRRDGEIYTVRKLADGNCWMTDNLRLGKNGSVALDSTNSNMTSGRTFTVPAANTTTGFTWDNQAEYPFVFYRDSNPYSTSPSGIVADGPSALYNWYTATAGARDASGNSLMTTTGTAVDSVCPKNWKLPINGTGYTTSKSYMNLVYTYTGVTGNGTTTIENVEKLLVDPLSFIYSDGYILNGTLNSRPVGNYWSSSSDYSATNPYLLYFATVSTMGGLYPQGDGSKGNAFAVRCVLAS